MTNLCSHILEFLARAACHLQKHPITRTLKDMFNQGEWDVLLSAIKNAEARVEKHSAVNGWKYVRMIREAQEKDELAQRTATLSKETVTRNEKITAFLKKLHEHAWLDGDSYEFSKDRVEPPGEPGLPPLARVRMTSSKHGSPQTIQTPSLLSSS